MVARCGAFLAVEVCSASDGGEGAAQVRVENRRRTNGGGGAEHGWSFVVCRELDCGEGAAQVRVENRRSYHHFVANWIAGKVLPKLLQNCAFVPVVEEVLSMVGRSSSVANWIAGKVLPKFESQVCPFVCLSTVMK